MDSGNSGGSAGEERVYRLDDLEQDYEGLWIPECPNPDCEQDGIVIDATGACPVCGLSYELEVRFDAR